MNISRPDIEFFINQFKQNFPKELEYVFTNGNCYHFSVILKHIYPEGEIWYKQLLGHFVFKLNDKFYDITGDVTKEQEERFLIDWENYKDEDKLHYNRLVRDCVYKLPIDRY